MLAVTMGDGNGVGPEIILKAFQKNELKGDFVVIGDYSVMEYCKEAMGFSVPLTRIENLKDVEEGKLNVLDAAMLSSEQITPGRISKEVAQASREYVCTASRLALEGKIEAVVTLPVNKEAIRLSDKNFTGHTELIAGICGQTDYTMMLASKKLTVTHVSTHVSMEQAIENVKKDRVLKVIKLTFEALHKWIEEPRIAVAGLNAHAGEGGAFGMEDGREIVPAVEEAKASGMNVTGPLPPDTVFLRAYKGEFDAVVCMYHDQGHIPMKLLDFDGGVNVSLGLKVVRTSVDHGTAYDIAYKNLANEKSFIEAYEYAKKIK
jgi:4-hydroxythreonine-4-phosphate dehydrogenase